ncbi:MAG: HIT domain-containing protein [Candidatus Liptonbacteria bacterium]|nr:HIT domain-containing protein [Candidatus Liptonbacteria bacterium]
MSELRRDPVSHDWIINAPERSGRPDVVKARRGRRRFPPRASCVFEEANLKKTGQWRPIRAYPHLARWEALVLPNKFPAVVHRNTCALMREVGPYKLLDGIGQHDLVITRDHAKGFADVTLKKATDLLRCLQLHYRALAKDSCLFYTSTFLNWGRGAGASVAHPHYQVLTLPIVPPDVWHSLSGSARYMRKHRRCVHCAMIADEEAEGSRILKEDKHAVAFVPFVSRHPFEARIFPRRHLSVFERTPLQDLQAVVGALQHTLKKIKKNLHDPDLNFFIHTAPLKHQNRFRHYHWHIEVVPAITIGAGFELSTGVEINIIDPNRAAEVLRA